jgi:hypothetical protein
MKSFKFWLREQLFSSKNDLLLEEAGAKADSSGKLREILIGKHLNGGKHMTSYRAEGKTPEQMHNKHAQKLHGDDYHNSREYKAADSSAKKAAEHLKTHLEKHGLGSIHRTVWTSQASDHHSETGVHDENNSADLIVSTNKKKRITEDSTDHKQSHKVAISVKIGHSKVNYSNPGIKTYQHVSGANLAQHVAKHKRNVESNLSSGSGNAHEKYKALRDSSHHGDQEKAKKIKQSSLEANKNIANSMRESMSKKSHNELHHAIVHTVAPPTHLKHIISRTKTHKSTGQHLSHHTYDLHKHVHEYLSHFKDLHVNPHNKSGTVTVHGTHHKTGKKMSVATFNVSAGGRPANHSPRGAVNLSSEDHKDIKYTDKSEHMEHKL